MARGRKKKIGLDVKQKISGPFLVTFYDEKKNDVYLPGISWVEVEKLHRSPDIEFIKIETIATKFYRPKDITKAVLKKLTGGK